LESRFTSLRSLAEISVSSSVLVAMAADVSVETRGERVKMDWFF